MSEKASSTKEVLEFIGDRMDSIAPVLKGAVKGVSENVGHYGKEWVSYRATEWIGLLATDVVFLMVSVLFLIIAAISFWYSFKAPKDSMDEARPSFLVPLFGGAIIAIVAGMCFLINLTDIAKHAPKAIAAYCHPEGFAVQLLIDGVTK